MAYGFLNGARYDGEPSSLATLIERTIIELKIPYGVKIIGSNSFSHAKTLKKIDLCEGIEKIDVYAFRDCGISNIELPQSASAISWGGFYNCTDLKTFKSGAALNTIGSVAFYNNTACLLYDFSQCKQIPSLTAVDAFNGINSEAKIFVPADLYDKWVSATNWSSLAEYIVPVCDAPEVTVPDYVSEGLDIQRAWGGYRVRGRGSCTDSVVVLPEEYKGEPIDALDASAFEDDETLEELYINGSVSFIDNLVCNGSGLKKLYMENVRNIASISFRCDDLEYVRFSSNISEIGGGAFHSSKAKTIYDFTAFKGESIPTLYLDDGAGGATLSPDKIIVPINRYSEWITATNWSYYAEYIVAAK